MKYILLAILSVLLSMCSAQAIEAPWGCYLHISSCLSDLAEENELGYDSSYESIWSFMNRAVNTNACRDIMKRYQTNPPFLVVSQGKGDELIACLNTI